MNKDVFASLALTEILKIERKKIPVDNEAQHGDLVVQCECGNQWLMDFEPTPETCQGNIWRLGVFYPEEGIDWGSWVDYEGNAVTFTGNGGFEPNELV